MNHAEINTTLAPLWLDFNALIESAYRSPDVAERLAARQQGIADAALALGCDQSFRSEVRRLVTQTKRRPHTAKRRPA